MRQEDRREDRQADRQADRRAEAKRLRGTRRAAQRRRHHQRDPTRQRRKARLAAGATEIQVRGLTAQDAKALLASNQNLLVDLAGEAPCRTHGIERQVRLRGAVDARVQRNDEGGSCAPESKVSISAR